MDKSKFSLLSNIKYPNDLRKLSINQLPEVCKELREDIIDEVAVNPGHFASSLGVVEITVALHYVYNTPEDRIVWDVGHQAYGHKILTGRREAFCTNRKLHGIRPFPTPLESEYDTFTCGHASNSISAALGMAVAARETGNKDRHVVAVIGDGAMSGGLAFEGLNNVSSTPNDMLIILNDNDMSIDRAVGGMEKYLLQLDTNETYNKIRFKASQWLHSKGILNNNRKNGIIRLNNAFKSVLSHQQNIFEGMNIRYFGPFDGHDVKEVVRILKQLRSMKGPKLLHLHTTKGKGYEPAEKCATIWHAPGKFDPETGERIIADNSNKPPKFQAVLTIGPIGNDAIQAIEEVEKETKMSVAHYDMRFVKPLDENILTEVGKKFKRIVTIEDGARMGGMGSAVLEWMSDHGYQPQITRLGLPDEFVEHGTVEQLREIVHLDHESIKNAIIGK